MLSYRSDRLASLPAFIDTFLNFDVAEMGPSLLDIFNQSETVQEEGADHQDFAPFELLPPDLTWAIISLVPEAVFELRLASLNFEFLINSLITKIYSVIT